MSEKSSTMLNTTTSTKLERKSLISSFFNLDRSQNLKMLRLTTTSEPAEPPTVMRTPATLMPLAHGAHLSPLLMLATRSKMLKSSQRLSSFATTFQLTNSSSTEIDLISNRINHIKKNPLQSKLYFFNYVQF
jgi:hypothetical protein